MAVVIAQIATIVPRIAGVIAITIGQTRTIKEVRPASNRIAPATNHTFAKSELKLEQTVAKNATVDG